MKLKRLQQLCVAVAVALAPAMAVQAQGPQLMLTAPSTDQAKIIAERYLLDDGRARALAQGDLVFHLEDESTSPLSHVTHVTFQQTVDGIPVRLGLAKINVMKDGRVLSANNRFATDVARRATASTPTLRALDAVHAVATHLGVRPLGHVERPQVFSADGRVQVFSGGELSGDQDIGAMLVYEPQGDALRLAWQVVVNRYDAHQEVLDIRIDAHDGRVLGSDNVVQFEGKEDHAHVRPKAAGHGTVYRVFAQPVESPQTPGASHVLVTNPSDDVASRFGWHDTRNNPAVGQPEYTDTRGNNVFAQWDFASANNASTRPAGVWDAGSGTLTFDWPWDESAQPFTEANARAATVNLFYWNNLVHDVMFHYGFDEAAGNFQRRNYVASNSSPRNNDEVAADALDGATLATPNLNNANFLPVPENALYALLLGKPRMQMYRWSAPGALAVISPFVDQYQAAPAAFGAALTAPFPGEVVLVDSGDAAPSEGCVTPYANAAAVNGKIALIRRGSCEFHRKVAFAEQNGAIAAIVYNHAGDQTIAMGEGQEGHTVTIPSMFVGQPGGDAIVAELPDGPVLVELLPPGDAGPDRDSDFDAGIVVHEYAHGISNRLSGRTTLSCHSGDEQQGEGWSDFYGLMFTLTPEVCSAPRGIGTYASFQPSTGPGIRRFPYSPDMQINPFTFADIADEQQAVPHGVGSVWASMLWDMSCKLMERDGVDSDLISRGGGNGTAMRLVTEGLRLGSCAPTFVQSRNNILAADAAFTSAGGGYTSNECVIWRSFARRGLGQSASSGTSSSRLDQTEAFDSPVQCRTYVEVEAGPGGSITPSGTMTLHFDTDLTLTVEADPGYVVDEVIGCGGTLDGNTYTTAVITEDCEVMATFAAIPVHAVTPVVVGQGSIAPDEVQNVLEGGTTSFTLSPDPNHHLVGVEGCGGTLSGNVYTTGTITAACTVTATFAIDTYVISTVVGAGGSVLPEGPFNAAHGSQPVITLTPDPGHAIDSVTGCGGTLVGRDYTLAAVSADCTVEATFFLRDNAVFKDGFEAADSTR